MMNMNMNMGYRGVIQNQNTPTQTMSLSYMTGKSQIVGLTNLNNNNNNTPIQKPIIKPTLREATGPQPDPNAPKKMAWGEPTWFLLHTLAQKVKDDRFQQIRGELLDTIFSICSNLPCPDCAEHAKMYLNRVNFNTIQTKDDLKNMLFMFHNTVNQNKNFPIFPYSALDDKYSKAITINIIYNFMNSFMKKSKSIRMIANDSYRERIAGSLKKWFNQNIQAFNP